ncbi:MAG: GNAT family N-acetyltransferase [Clostridia bacterium]|nr:GNAT family N-acetyltransferase [Clostridia bacterium]
MEIENVNLFSVRKAVFADVDDIFAITREAFERYAASLGRRVSALDENTADVEKDIAEKTVLVVSFENAVVGSLRLCEKEGWAYLSRFGVSTKARGEGAGAALLKAAAAWAREKNLKGVCLHTASDMRELVRFYYLHGFHVDSTDKSRGYTRALMVMPFK